MVDRLWISTGNMMSGFGLLLLGGLRRRFRVRTVWFRGVCWLTGFEYQGMSGAVGVGLQGIFKPSGHGTAAVDHDLSEWALQRQRWVRTSCFGTSIERTDPYHRDNVGLSGGDAVEIAVGLLPRVGAKPLLDHVAGLHC